LGKFIDLTGQRFGKLVVLRRVEDYIQPSGKPMVMWECQCDCMQKKVIAGTSLKSGKTTSCGCYGKEQRLKSNTKHGLSHSRLKRIYYNMKSRCYNSNTPKFKNHGGRGITVCDEWLGENGFINFYNWSFQNGYSEKLTLDRIDNDGNYEPNNCKWSTYEEQNFNRRNNRLFTINEETRTAKEWCKLTNTNINTFWQRDLKGLTGEELIK
jgi:hypothetical protein